MLETPDRISNVLLIVVPVALWCVWWLLGVNWRTLGPVLTHGGWLPAVLLLLIATMVWTYLAPGPGNFLGLGLVAEGWWQFLAVLSLALTALFCGWLQNYFGWTPPQVSIEPTAVAVHEHAGGHGHP